MRVVRYCDDDGRQQMLSVTSAGVTIHGAAIYPNRLLRTIDQRRSRGGAADLAEEWRTSKTSKVTGCFPRLCFSRPLRRTRYPLRSRYEKAEIASETRGGCAHIRYVCDRACTAVDCSGVLPKKRADIEPQTVSQKGHRDEVTQVVKRPIGLYLAEP